MQEHTKHNIEALRSELKEKLKVYQHSRDFKIGIKSNIVRQKIMISEVDKDSIDTVINQFLENIK